MARRFVQLVPPGSRPGRRLCAAAVVLLGAAAVAWAYPGGPAPAEETRLPAEPFRKGLQDRGLTELLELHLREFPPANLTSRLLVERELKLAEAADPTRTPEQRQAALADANRRLATLIDQAGDDQRRFEWQLELARSRLYDEAEPYYVSILYRGGSPADRTALLRITEDVVRRLGDLNRELAQEFERIDGLSVRDFEKVERGGYVEALDRAAPQAKYLQLWAWFYDALARDDGDPRRAHNLHAVLDGLAADPQLLKPQVGAAMPERIPGLLLAGMTQRLLNDHVAAQTHLQQALDVAARVTSPARLVPVEWAIRLARLEQIRNDRDAGQFDRAITLIEQYRRQLNDLGPDAFGVELVLALLERSVHRAQAEQLEAKGRTADADRCRRLAWEPLARLAHRTPERRDEIYATLYDLIPPDANPADLDAFEQAALIAGLLFDAGQTPGDATLTGSPPARLLDRAIDVAQLFLSAPPAGTETLVPEVRFNLAVALYRRGRAGEAAEQFIAVARDDRDFADAQQAAVLAVEICAELHQAGGPIAQAGQERYLDALEVLVLHYGQSEAARYWRFYYAQLLEKLSRYTLAAYQYAQIEPGHEQYLAARFGRVRALAQAVLQRARREPDALVAIRRAATDVVEEQRAFAAEVRQRQAEAGGEQSATPWQQALAETEVLTAELQVLPQVGQPERALEVLERFPAGEAGPALQARVLRVKLLAYEQLGRLAEATDALPAYIASDPERAGATLQSLYASLVEEIDELRRAQRDREADQKAASALLLATHLGDWLHEHAPASLPRAQRRIIEVQVAEAHLAAQRYADAHRLFDELRATLPEADQQRNETDLRILLGCAEARFGLKEHAEALPMFNELATALPAESRPRWVALLRDLQCRTELGHDPAGILQVINQQEFLHPDLGGPDLADQFKQLRRRNEKRNAGP